MARGRRARLTQALKPRGGVARIPHGPAFALALLISAGLFAATAAPSPFLELQQREWGVLPAQVTAAVGLYAGSFLVGLLVLGALADSIGYRPVLAGALALQAATCVAFLVAPSIELVLVARAAQGLGMGAAVGAVGASIILFTPWRASTSLGTTLAVVSTQLGSAAGSFTAGWAIQSLIHPTPVVYGVYVALFVGCAVAVLFLPSDEPRAPVTWRTLTPRVAMLANALAAFWRAVPVIVAGWMISALYLGLVPIIVRELLGSVNPLIGGLTVAVYSTLSGMSGLAAQRTPALLAVRWASVALVAGAVLASVAAHVLSFPLFALATVLCSVGFGVSNTGAVRTIIPLVDAQHRAMVFSATYVVGYLAFGLPVIVAGLAASTIGVLGVAAACAAAAAALAAVGFVLALRSVREHPIEPETAADALGIAGLLPGNLAHECCDGTQEDRGRGEARGDGDDRRAHEDAEPGAR